ncbi:hypothetical protein GDO78_021065 [Eleutherodactylus coqui]|uniref:Uncharacterized protein n=1 Tax=Eleutherodactylus coqui TaxID=57060 RepID=A0A8J6BDP8_ELECQ|nr:hypothetical protein GDO78_021065 [Eleutherodactylus coqui]
MVMRGGTGAVASHVTTTTSVLQSIGHPYAGSVRKRPSAALALATCVPPGGSLVRDKPILYPPSSSAYAMCPGSPYGTLH